jgi:tRNA threonylcarbamoyladenosine biosynthesis protein TsaB
VRILAFDTATRATSVALCDGRTFAARDDPAPGQRPRHMTRLMPLIAEVLDQAGCAWGDIERIAVGRGPGTFTGLRVGVTTARALARSLNCPLVGVSTLHSLALNVCRVTSQQTPPDTVLAVLDARRGETFAAAWRVQRPGSASAPLSLGELLLTQRAITPADLTASIAALGQMPMALGEGAVEFREILEPAGARIPGDASDLHRVTAVNHCHLAAGAHGADPGEVHPEYLRLPDAEIARRAAEPR